MGVDPGLLAKHLAQSNPVSTPKVEFLTPHDDGLTQPDVTSDEVRHGIRVILAALFKANVKPTHEIIRARTILLRAERNRNWVMYVP